jgi:hypothetical protein
MINLAITNSIQEYLPSEDVFKLYQIIAFASRNDIIKVIYEREVNNFVLARNKYEPSYTRDNVEREIKEGMLANDFLKKLLFGTRICITSDFEFFIYEKIGPANIKYLTFNENYGEYLWHICYLPPELIYLEIDGGEVDKTPKLPHSLKYLVCSTLMYIPPNIPENLVFFKYGYGADEFVKEQRERASKKNKILMMVLEDIYDIHFPYDIFHCFSEMMIFIPLCGSYTYRRIKNAPWKHEYY